MCLWEWSGGAGNVVIIYVGGIKPKIISTYKKNRLFVVLWYCLVHMQFHCDSTRSRAFDEQ